jgi:hypothetical protein
MFNSKSFALKAILPVAGVALAAGVIGTAAPAKAMPIVIDNFSTSGSGVSSFTNAPPSSSAPASYSGTGLTNAQRSISFGTTAAQAGQFGGFFQFFNNQAIVSASQGVSSLTTINYTFNPTNFSSSPLVNLNYTMDSGDPGSTVQFLFSLGGNTRSSSVLTAAVTSAPLVFDFSSFNLAGVTSASLQIVGGSGRDISITSPITANPPTTVPVPPAILATGVGAVIGGLKASRKRQQQAVMA